MLRTIMHQRRRRLEVKSSSTSSSSATTAEEEEDGLESWVEWIKRVTREAELERDKYGIKSWEAQFRLRKLRWAGHVARLPNERWAKVLLVWQLADGTHRRVRGHPRKRWSDELDVLGDWMVLAQEREDWRKVSCNF